MMLKRKRSEKVFAGDEKGLDEHHPKNPYKSNKPNFFKLAKKYPELLEQHVHINPVSGKGTIDFTNKNASRALTQALLLQDFGADVNIPEDHLCPPLPNRVNYLCWLSDLIESYSENQCSSERSPKVLDIGVGPVAIYPILGHSLFGWNFVGTDVDATAVQHCEENLHRNPRFRHAVQVYCVSDSSELQRRINETYLPQLSAEKTSESNSTAQPTVLAALASQESMSGPIRTAVSALNSGDKSSTTEGAIFTATMCNPPFYSEDEQIQAAKHTVCTGSTSEMRTVGGEVAFICAMIADSLILRDRVVWYTSMVGKRSSLHTLTAVLQTEGIPRTSIFTTTLKQGVTHRWCIAWTFLPAAAERYRRFLQQQERQHGQKEQHIAPDNGSSGSTNAAISVPTASNCYQCKLSVPSIRSTRLSSDALSLTEAISSCGSVVDLSVLGESLQLAVERVVVTVVDHQAAAAGVTKVLQSVQSHGSNDAHAAGSDAESSVPKITLYFNAVIASVRQETNDSVERDRSAAEPVRKEDDDVNYLSSEPAYTMACEISVIGEEVSAAITYSTNASVVDGAHSFNREYFNKDYELLLSDLQRTNRRWRRKLAATNTADSSSAGRPEVASSRDEAI